MNTANNKKDLNQQAKTIDKIKNDLVQILNILKRLYEYSSKYDFVDIRAEKDKQTIKHLIEDEIYTLKENINNLEDLIEFVRNQINYAKQSMHLARQQNDQKQYTYYSKQLSYYIENLERVYNSYIKLNELVQKYYNMITDYENKLIDNINKTYRSLLYKEDRNSDNIFIAEIYQQVEDILKRIQTEQKNSTNQKSIDNTDNIDIINEQLFNDTELDKYKL